MKYVRALAVLGAVLAWSAHLTAQETHITVRVIANDAKIIGTGVGGALITIKNAATGEVLAEGVHEGATGNTDAIMVEPRVRGASVFDVPDAAQFTATIVVDTPTVVEVTAVGPLGYEQAMQRAATTVLVVPGEDITGDGIVLTLHGFIVELLEPEAATRGDVQVRARVRMLCGCPFTPGGLWDSNRLTIEARVYDGARVVRSAPLAYEGERNMFGGPISLEGVPAGARLVVLVSDAERVNFGRSNEREIR